MLELNAVLSTFSNANCSIDFFGFVVLDATDEGRVEAGSELVSLVDLLFVESPGGLSFDCTGTVFVTTGLSTEDDTAKLPRRAHPAPGGSAELSSLAPVGEGS